MPSLQEARLRHALHYIGVAAPADKVFREGGAQTMDGLRRFDEERTQFDAVWGWLLAADVRTRGITDPLLVLLADATAYTGGLRYDKRRERIPQLEAALAAAGRLGERELEGWFVGNLGVAYNDLGAAPKAIGYFEQALAIAREIRDRPGEASALGNVGQAHLHLGEVHAAIGSYQEARAITREIGDRPGEVQVLGNLGLAYADLGEVRESITYYEQALAIAREIEDHWGEGLALGGMGNAYLSLAEAGNAIAYCPLLGGSKPSPLGDGFSKYRVPAEIRPPWAVGPYGPVRVVGSPLNRRYARDGGVPKRIGAGAQHD